jgi:hypothetical protein
MLLSIAGVEYIVSGAQNITYKNQQLYVEKLNVMLLEVFNQNIGYKDDGEKAFAPKTKGKGKNFEKTDKNR